MGEHVTSFVINDWSRQQFGLATHAVQERLRDVSFFMLITSHVFAFRVYSPDLTHYFGFIRFDHILKACLDFT